MTLETYTLTVRDMCRELKCSRQTLYAWMKSGRVPEPKRFSKRALRWSQDDLRACMERPA